MNFGLGLRGLVYLRRIARALERHAEAAESLARIETSRWEAETVRKVPRKMVWGQLNVEKAQEDYARRQRLEERGE